MMPSIRRQQRVLFWRLHSIPSTRRNRVRVYLPTHTSTEWCSRTKNRHILKVTRRQHKGNDQRETSTKVILGWSGEYDHLSNESLHNIRSARCYPPREVLWKETRLIPHQDIRLYCICAHSPREKANAWSKIGKMHSCGLPLEQKGYHCLDPSTWKVHVSWDVVFDESTSWYKLEATAPEPYTADLNNTEDNNQLRSIGGQYPRRVQSQLG